jgi:hypothetical protein
MLNSFAVAYTTDFRMTGMLFVLSFRHNLLDTYKLL